MENIVEVTGGPGGSAFLAVGSGKTALLDCGMAYCAEKLIHNIKQNLGGRNLDYILISHSHYDHIGAIPWLKQEWPDSVVYGAAYARKVLRNPDALRTIRQLSRMASSIFARRELGTYNESLLKVDEIIGNGSVVELGGFPIEVLETPGHTKCSLAFLLHGDTLFASETTGCLSKAGRFYPGFITSCSQAVKAVALCRQINPAFIISPHLGFISAKDMPDYWQRSRRAIEETRDFILAAAQAGDTVQQILNKYEARFRDAQSSKEQPLQAFRLNTLAMITRLLETKEYKI